MTHRIVAGGLDDEGVSESVPGICGDRGSCLGHQLREEREIVVRNQPRPEHLLGAEQMRDVAARVGAADGARATFIERAFVEK